MAIAGIKIYLKPLDAPSFKSATAISRITLEVLKTPSYGA